MWFVAAVALRLIAPSPSAGRAQLEMAGTSSG